jgi:integrase
MEPRAGFASETKVSPVASASLQRNSRSAAVSSIGDILSYALWMEKQGYKPLTIRGAVGSLKSIDRRTNLLDVQAVLGYLARIQVSEVRKENLSNYLDTFYKWKGLGFKKPRYKRANKLSFIPTENEVDQLIGGVGRKTAAFLQLLKETGIRPCEAWAIKWSDIDTERSVVSTVPEKGSNARQPKISGRLMAMLNALPHKWILVFHNPELDAGISLDHFRRVFNRQRLRVSERLENPRIRQISFKTLRHFRATMFYHQTKDILATMQVLGHKNIRNTLIYTHLVDWSNDEFVCKVAKTVTEAQQLVESGFDYVCEVDGLKLFRKRK